VLEDMYEKVEELQQVLKEHISTKNALKVPLLATQTNPLLCYVCAIEAQARLAHRPTHYLL